MTILKDACYIGRVRRSPRYGERYNYASVEPLVESDAGGTRWVGPVQDAVARFPKRGLVHWHDAPLDLQEGSIWQFTLDEHPYAEREDRLEELQLKDPKEPIEVLDLRGWEDELALRSTITSEGIPLRPAPIARRCLLWLRSGLFVGPLRLKPANTEGFWALESPAMHRDSTRMPVWRIGEADVNQVWIEGQRWFLSPPLELGQSAGIQNWTSDAQTARAILARLRRMNRELVEALRVTDNVFREYLDHVENARLGSTDPTVERARADRLRGVRQAIQRDSALMAEAVESLLKIERLRAEVDRKVQAKIDEEVRRRRADVDAALSEASAKLSSLEASLQTKQAELAALDAALIEKLRELDDTVASFDRELSTRLEEVARRPEALFAEMAMVRAVIEPIFGKRASAGAPSRGEVFVQSTESREANVGEPPTELHDNNAVRQALVVQSGVSEVSLYALLGLHAAFVAGIVPVLIGSQSYRLVHAYASAVAGGRLHWIPVGSSMMEPTDLLGRFDPSWGRLLPAPSGLLEVVKHAQSSGRLHVLVLEGFNRAPTECYLSPILESARAVRHGDAIRTIPLASPGLLPEDDPYRGLARVAWPSNLLIACLTSDGTMTLPVPSSVWRFLGVLDADDRDRTPMPRMPVDSDAQQCTEISPDLWRQVFVTACRKTAGDHGEVAAFAGSLMLDRDDVTNAVRMRDVLTASGLPSSEATALAVSATLIPRAGSVEEKVDEVIRSAGLTVPGWRTIWTEAQRLRG